MDEEMEIKEIRFSQNLSSNLPKTRRRALTRLHDYIRNTSKSKQFTPENLDRLARGLHYAMWMQDKMLQQEELSDEYGSLIELFCTEDEVIEYLRSMLRTLSKHWGNIDSWRMDKFLQLIRRLFRAYFVHLRNKEWNAELVEKATIFLQQTVITPEDGGVCEALKLHFANIYLEELDYAGDLSKEQFMDLLRPYTKLMQKSKTSNYFFGSVCTEIFGTILERFAADLEKEEFEDEKLEGDLRPVGKPLEFDYTAIAQLLRETAKAEGVPSKRRKRIEKMASQFEAAAEGRNPFAETIAPSTEKPIKRAQVAKALDKLVSQASKIRKERAKFKKERRKYRKVKPMEAF